MLVELNKNKSRILVEIVMKENLTKFELVLGRIDWILVDAERLFINILRICLQLLFLKRENK